MMKLKWMTSIIRRIRNKIIWDCQHHDKYIKIFSFCDERCISLDFLEKRVKPL